MAKPFRNALVLLLCLLLSVGRPVPASAAEPTLEETRKLLEKGLTIYELEQEITRLTEKETRLEAKLAETERTIRENEQKLVEVREHAGHVLRAYYMGDRDSVWMLLFSVKSLSDAIFVLESLTLIVENDQRALNAYADSYKKLKDQKESLLTDSHELQQVKTAFVRERDRVVALQEEVNRAAQASPEAQEVFKQIVDLTTQWRDKGLPVFRSYFQAMATEMENISELLGGSGGNRYLNGLTFQISDTDLIAFFRSKNPLFDNVTFSFQGGSFRITGNEKDVAVSIKGHYVLKEAPANRLTFRIEELVFNGFPLPDTTIRAMEEDFPLGISPDKVVPFVQASEVSTDNGLLTLKMKLKLK
ncbi:hypothetical protein J31TS4_29350 [Paenibacillus sp. J31TS4]|uniref:coiled-coil domain-containing protein n=1 Tax=Paenibacillus sp. J31TS4 TaxID=2807195 RepID=UPI001AFD3DE3|nr:hypothetical protein [Paenibacillus sp. J31TS4]GIP39655.1 hypothetical protein J31TS4_29350 [Paenibacillus sp. J31TS4]